MVRVLMVRHALSVWNVEGRWQGQADPPLSAEGEAEAQAAGARVGPVGVVVTSDLLRAQRTGELLAPHAVLLTEPLLRELDVGMWSGRTRDEIEREWPGALARFDAGLLAEPPGGESRTRFEDRVAEAAAQTAARVDRCGAAKAVVVAHGGVIRALARMQHRPDRHVAHLCGFEAEVKGANLVLGRPVDLRTVEHESHEPGDRLVF